jgi:hypothetical protein
VNLPTSTDDDELPDPAWGVLKVMTDNSDGWIKHEPGPCPIPDAGLGEWSYISVISEPEGIREPSSPAIEYQEYWLDGSITHYRLHTPAPDKDAVIAELRAARAEAEKWRKVAEGLASDFEAIRDDSYTRQIRDKAHIGSLCIHGKYAGQSCFDCLEFFIQSALAAFNEAKEE